MKNVSIIIPVYNVQKYLSRCVESVLDQTYDGYELILIDDGSSDNSGIMCDQYAIKDKRIKVIHKENGGLSSARNAGLEIAQGEFVFFLDSDDVIHPHTMETLTSELKKDVDVVIGGFRRFSLDDELSHELIRNTKLSEIIGGGSSVLRKCTILTR